MDKFLFITCNRSEYFLVEPLIEFCLKNKFFSNFKLIVGGTHYKKEYGKTVSDIKINLGDKIIKMNYLKNIQNEEYKNVSLPIIKELNMILKKEKPKIAIIVGDRYETLIISTILFAHNVYIVHFHGGELTYGSKDDIFRHCVSKLSNLHMVAHTNYKNRLIKFGENPRNIYLSGPLGYLNFKNKKLFNKNVIKDKLKINNKNNSVVVTFHSETNKSKKENINNLNILLNSILKLNNLNIVFTGNSFDPYSSLIKKKILISIENKSNFFYFESLGSQKYFSLIKNSKFMIGNSSSGIYESCLLKTPCINLGDRQKGRLLSDNIINCEFNLIKLNKIIKKVLNNKFKFFYKYPFKKNNENKILEKISKHYNNNNNKNKIFYQAKNEL